MSAREAMYKANMQSLQGLLPGLRLERTRLAEVSKEREAAAERARREQLEREASDLRNQLSSERQNREAQAAELTRLRNQMEENQRQIQQQMMQDRQARLDAEQRFRNLSQEYNTAMQGNVGAAELARLRRQIEDQQDQIRTIQQREALSDRAMADQLQRSREDLARERSGGLLTPAQLTAREEALNQTASEFERIRRERQEAEQRLQRLSEETTARLTQNEERLRAAEERARAAEAELQAQRDRMAKMEQQLSTLAETRRDERGFIVTLPGIFFDTGKSELKQGSRDTLARIANELRSNEAVSIVVEGHTDSVGSEQMNQQLSERRANAVRAFLIENGVPAARVTTIGRGEGSPVASNDTASGRQQNRRVELVIQQAR
jgi:outer membrane protein OmpA-like peptidoglycan-associated protein